MIAAALAAGASAGAGVPGNATEAVDHGYGLLKGLIRCYFPGQNRVRRELEADQTDPGVWQARIGQDLHDSGAATDRKVLAAARELLAAADPGRAARMNITVGTVHGAVGVFHGPVTFDQRSQLPPTRPAAG